MPKSPGLSFAEEPSLPGHGKKGWGTFERSIFCHTALVILSDLFVFDGKLFTGKRKADEKDGAASKKKLKKKVSLLNYVHWSEEKNSQKPFSSLSI